MSVSSLGLELFSNIREFTHDAFDGLPGEALTWRVDPDANTIAWLTWHLARVQDDHIAHLAGSEQVWARDGWAAHFGLDADEMRIGYGDTSDDVAGISASASTLLGYLDAATDRTLAWLRDAEHDDWDRIVDERWDPPVTARVRLASIVSDDLQHVGQIAYLAGLHRRS